MRFRSRRRGAIIILASLSMLLVIAMAALVIDINRAYTSRQKMATASDLAALSAAALLPDQSSASTSAEQIAEANGATSQSITFPQPGSIRISMQRTEKYFFAPFLGIQNKVVSAGATAVSRGGKIAPIAIQDVGLTPGQEYMFAWKNLGLLVPLTSLDWLALSIGGSGGANFINRLENSYSSNYPKGSGKPTETSVTTATAAATGIVSDAGTANAIFEQAARAPWNDTGVNYSYPNYPVGDPRIVMVALVDQPDAGSSSVTINRFGSAYVRDYGLGVLTLVWLGDFTAASGNPNRGWFATKGLTKLLQ